MSLWCLGVEWSELQSQKVWKALLGEKAIHKVLVKKFTQLAMSSDIPFAPGYIAQIMEEDGRGDVTDHILEGTLD